jgi:hypothetical protein
MRRRRQRSKSPARSRKRRGNAPLFFARWLAVSGFV